MVPQRSFCEATDIHPAGSGRFDAEVDPQWTIGGRPNGGYLLAMLSRAATHVVIHDHVIAASAQYLCSPEPGPVAIDTEGVRVGRSVSQVRARMSQGSRTCVEALFTLSHLEGSTLPYWDRGIPAPGIMEFEGCNRVLPLLANGTTVAIMEQIDLRIEPDSLGFTTGQPTGRGELRGWLALPFGETFDPISLLFAVDAFPPATFDIEFSGWVPTLALTAYVRALPAGGPVRILYRAQLIDAQRVDEACFVWDGRGRLVAQGTQLAGVRLG